VEYRYLGKSGMKVSELCLGGLTLGREADQDESHRILDYYFSAGGNFIDTANIYGGGRSEEVIGVWLQKQPRDKVVLATKVRFAVDSAPNSVGLSRKHILTSVETSLRRLYTDHIDLLQLHCWDPGTPLAETLGTLNGLVQQGKVRYIGVSNFAGYQLQKAVAISQQHGWEQFVSLQPLYNLLDRTIEWELLPVCANEGIAVMPWSPLRGGWLSGKYRRGMTEPLENTRVDAAEKNNWSESWSKYNNERTWNIIDRLIEVAEQVGKTPAQVALRWLLQRPGVTSPIVGVRHVHHLEENLGALGWQLDNEMMLTLNTVSAIDVPYPYDFIARQEKQRTRSV
jgi:aryl-alcohol dehydrogenase-like predicted oxidoreductase